MTWRQKEHVHSTIVAQLPDEIVEDFRRLNLGIIAHIEGITIEVEPTLSKKSVRVRLVMLKFKRSRILSLKVEVQNSQKMSKAQYGSRIGYVFLRLIAFVRLY
jgi:hypothetical protein